MYVIWLIKSNLAELEPAKNITDFTLNWGIGSSIEEVLSVVKRWQNLNRLTLIVTNKICVPPLEVLSDFIMGMKHLSHLDIFPDYDHSNSGQLKILSGQVNEFILPRRPNFKLDISPFFD